MNKFALKKCVDTLLSGGIIAYPTESVYGIGCDPTNINALERLISLKKRSINKGLILVAADFQQLEPFLAPLDVEMLARVMQSWPGPTNWLLPANPDASQLLRGQYKLQAVRVSANKTIRAICEKFGGAIVSTSANLSNRPAAKSALQTRLQFRNNLDFIVNGKVDGQAKPCKIISSLDNTIVRGS